MKKIHWFILLFSLCCASLSAVGEEGSTDPVPAIQTELVYEAHVTIGPSVEVGKTPQGVRRYIPITGGHFSGPRLSGVILPGGADWQTERPDGVLELDALYSMQCDDGTTIIVHNQGILSEGGRYLKTVPSFNAPEGPHAWLNQYQFIGTVSGSDEKDTVVIRVYRVL